MPKPVALVASLACLLALSFAASAEAGVKIVAPQAVAAPQRAPFAVKADGRVVRVAFYVDGQRRWLRRAAGRRFGRRGTLDTARLGPGRHVLLVRAKKRGGRVVRDRRLLRVAANRAVGPERPAAKGSRGQGKTKPKPEPAPAPTSDPEPEPLPEPQPQPEPEAEPQPGEEPLFRGDFDEGWKGWYVQSLSSRATIFGSGAFEGSGAARFEVRAGDVEPDTGSQRSEVSGPTFDEGQDLYIRDAIRVPSGNTYSAPWQIIQQLHEEDWGGSPGVAVFLDNQRALRLGAGDGSPTFWQGPQLQADRWHDLVYRVNLSRQSTTGFVEVWLDGVQQTLANGKTRISGQTIQAAQTYIKAGIYRSKSSSGTSVVEHDAIAIGTSYAAVTSG